MLITKHKFFLRNRDHKIKINGNHTSLVETIQPGHNNIWWKVIMEIKDILSSKTTCQRLRS